MQISIESEKKICILKNDIFSWRLIVDGEDISFVGASNADYFEKHYKKLGYEIRRESILSEDE